MAQRTCTAALLILLAAVAGAQTQSTTTLLPEQQAQHALSRLAFGPRPGDAAKVRAMGVEKWIDLQLAPEKIDDRAATDALRRYPALDAQTADIAAAFREQQRSRREAQRRMGADSMNPNQQPPQPPPFDANAARQLPNRAINDLYNAKLERAATSERQLYEVMVDFWENHFSVFVGKGQVRVYLPEYDRDVIRPRAMGKFRDLLGAVAKSPAMLFYLDNAQSQADSAHPRLQDPRQFAQRGRGRPGFPPPRPQAQQQPQQIERYCNSQRTEANLPQRLAQAPPEVVESILKGTPAECIRTMTQLVQRAQQPSRGLNENYARELMELHTLGVDGGYSQQDVIEVARALTGWTIDQQRGAFLFNPVWHDAGAKTVLGTTLPAGRGMDDGEQVLDLVARHPSTARFITTKLARRFISDDPPASVVDRCSKVFTKTDGDIRLVVGCVVKSPEFMSPAAYRAKVKTPFEVVVSAMRATNSQIALRPGAPQAVNFLGQPLFGRQTPDGWPDVGREWMNAGAILNRINFGLALAVGRVPGLMRGVVPELEAVRLADRDKQVDAVVRVLFGGQVSPETREILMSGENPLAQRYADTTQSMDARPERMRLNPARANQGPVNMTPVSLTGLDQIIGLALGAPEFQRR